MKKVRFMVLAMALCLAVVFVLGVCDGTQSAATAAQKGKAITWRYNGNFNSEGIPGRGQRYFCELVKERSGGRLVIEPYFSASLGLKQANSLTALKRRLVEINEITAAAGEEPITGAGQLPFLHRDMYSYIDWMENKCLPAEQRTYDRGGWNCRIFAPLLFPSPNYFFSKKPLTKTSNFKGLQIRTWGGSIIDEGIRAITASPITISTAELYTALQRGMVTAAITSYTSATETHFWEVLKYINKIPIIKGSHWRIAVNKDALNSLPKDLQKTFLACASDYANWQIAENMRAYYRLERMLTDGGMEVIMPEAGTWGKMRQMCIDAGVYRKLADIAGPDGKQLIIDLGLY